MTISQICKLSQEVERNELLTTVVLDGVYKSESKEADGEFVLRVTYPTEAVKILIQQVTEKLTGKTHKGGIVVRGSYGSGKSHALLTLFHLCADSERANNWLRKWGMPFTFPENVRVAAVQLVAEGAENLWELLLKRLGEDELLSAISRFPSRDQWAELGRKKPTVLLIDELEAWYESAEGKAVQRNALQNLMEAAELEGVPLSVVVSVYGTNEEIMAVLNRTQPPTLDVGTAADRWKIVRHRLLDDLDEEKAREVVQKYLRVYENLRDYLPQVQDFDELRREMEQRFPFHPHFLNKVFEVYGLMPRNEMTRGVIALCATLLRRRARERDFILAGDLDALDEEIASDLRKLEPQKVENAQKDLQERCKEIHYAPEFLGAALLYSVGNQQGISEGEMWVATIRPDRNINELRDALEEVGRKALFFEKQNGFWVVTVEESLEKRLEQDARLLISTPEGREKAAERLKKEIRDTFGGDVTLYPDEEIKSGGTGLKFVVSLSPLRADVDELRPLLPDNTVVLLAPSPSVRGKVTEDNDWLLATARVMVCEELIRQRHKRQRDLQRFKNNFEEDLKRLIDSHFAVWLRLSRTGELGEEPKYVARSENVRLRKEEVEGKLRETFDPNAFKDAVVKILRRQGHGKRKGEDLASLTIRQIRDELRREVGLPILGSPTESAFNEALKMMLEDQNEKTGIVVGVGKSIYGYPPNIMPPQPFRDDWRVWLKEYGPEPPAPEDLKAKVRATLQKVQGEGIFVGELRRKVGAEMQEVRRAVADLVNNEEAVMEADSERYPEDGHLPVDKVQPEGTVWLREFAPPDDRKAREEILRLVEAAGEKGITWGEVKERLRSQEIEEAAIVRALERLRMGEQVSVFEGENQLLEEIPAALLSDEVKLKRPVAYLPPTHPSHEAFSVSIQPYRLPSSKDLWLGEIRSKLDDAAQVERVSCEIQFPITPEEVRSIAEVTERWQICWTFKVAAGKDELFNLCRRWVESLPEGMSFVVSTEIEGRRPRRAL
jgi:hypothetical protein